MAKRKTPKIKQKKNKNKKNKSAVKKKDYSKKRVNNDNSKWKVYIYVFLVILISVVILRDIKNSNILIMIVLLYYIGINLFYEEIQKYTILITISAWTSIFAFLAYGFAVKNFSLSTNLFITFFIIISIIRNIVVFFKTVELSHIQTNLSVAIATIFQIVIAYGLIYKLIYYYIPNSFRFELLADSSNELFLDLVYFSFATFTTLGYGDIVPIHFISKIVVITEVSLFVILLTISIIFISGRKASNR